MSKPGIYENLPLKPLAHSPCETESLLRPTKPSFILQNVLVAKKRKSTPDAGSARLTGQPKQSKSTSDVLRGAEQQEGGAKSSSSETLKAASEEGEEVSPARGGHRKGTPTSTLDDGYESCNSTPHGSSGKLCGFSL